MSSLASFGSMFGWDWFSEIANEICHEEHNIGVVVQLRDDPLEDGICFLS